MTGQKNRFKTSEKLWNIDDKQLKTPKHDAMILWLMDDTNLKPLLKPLINDKDLRESTRIEQKRTFDDEVMSCNIQSEVPLKSSPTFIAGYADLIINTKYNKFVKEYNCPIKEEWLPKLEEMKFVDEVDFYLHMCLEEEIIEIDESYRKDIERVYWDTIRNEKARMKFYDSLESDLRFPIDSHYYERLWDSEKEHVIERYAYTNRAMILWDFVRNMLVNLGYDTTTPDVDLLGWIKGYHYYSFLYTSFDCLIEVKPYIDSFGAVLRQIKSYSNFWRPSSYNKFICLFTLDDRFDKQFESQGIHVLHPPKDFDIEKVIEYYGL